MSVCINLYIGVYYCRWSVIGSYIKQLKLCNKICVGWKILFGYDDREREPIIIIYIWVPGTFIDTFFGRNHAFLTCLNLVNSERRLN